jgi:NhaP-type Na+/H+ or K+/H+ antiporter
VDVLDLTFALVGLGALMAALLPRLLANRPLSMPIVFLALGVAVFAVFPDLPDPDPLAHPAAAEHLTEIGVIVALMGAGLKLDRPLGRRSWSSTWRLLAIAMPLTIAATALLGWWWAGLVPAAALLLGSSLAPTDPVLASDVQVGDPGGHAEGEDEVRFALTSEAGLNDALAFPFVYAAIAMAAAGTGLAGWIGDWALQDVLVKLAVGVVGGIVVGRALGALFFRSRSEKWYLASQAEGFVALAATFLAYGLTEVAGGYGFLAVFLCARSLRATERGHEYHQVLHDFVEQIERLLTVLLLVLFGGTVGARAAGRADLAGRGRRDRRRPGRAAAVRVARAPRRPGFPRGTGGDLRVRHPRDRVVLLPRVRHEPGRVPRRRRGVGGRGAGGDRVRRRARRRGRADHEPARPAPAGGPRGGSVGLRREEDSRRGADHAGRA